MLGSLTVAARGAVQARRQGRARAACRSSAALRHATTASRASGAGSSTACCAARWSRPCAAAGDPDRARDPRARACTRSTRASPGLPRDLPIMQTYDRIQAAFPGGPLPAVVVVQAQRRDRRRRSRRASRPSSARRSPPARCPSPIDASTSARTSTVAIVAIPLAGNGTDATSDARARRRCATTSSPRRSASVARRRGERHRHARPARRTSTTR